jgi:hypothetical protein
MGRFDQEKRRWLNAIHPAIHASGADDLVVGFESEGKPSDSWKHFGNDWLSSDWNYTRRKHD